MPRNEDQVAVFDASLRPLQIVVEMRRFVILVDPEESDVEIIAGICEVIRIAAEERDTEFRRKHEPDIRVLLVLVEVVNLAGIERYDITAHSGRRGTIFLDLRHGGALGLVGIRRRHLWLHTRVDLIGYILDADQLVELQVGALRLFGLRLSIEAGFDVVVAFRGKLLDALRAHVMVGEGQSVGRHEGSGAAVVESNRRQAKVVQPRLRDFKTVLGFDLVFWRSVVEPHAFVGCGQSRKDKGKRQQNCKKTFHFGVVPP